MPLGVPPKSPGNAAAQPATELGSLEPHPSGVGSDCSAQYLAPEGAPTPAEAALAHYVSVAAEGDVDTEVVVVAAAPVGAGRDPSAAGGGRVVAASHLRRRRTKVLLVGCESAEPTSGFSGLRLPVGAPELGPA